MKKRTEPTHASIMSLGDLMLEAMRRSNREGSLMRRVYILSLWEDVVGKNVASRTQQIFLKDKKLFVELGSSVARSELLMLRSDIIRRINQKAQADIVTELILK